MMDVRTIDDIISLIMRRDGISENEARHLVWECRYELNSIVSSGYEGYDEAVDCIEDYLGLEPDYLDILLG